MKTVLLYLLVLILCFPTFAGAGVMVPVEKDSVPTQTSGQSTHEMHTKQPHGQIDHSMHQMQDDQEQSLSSEHSMSTEHDCCAEEDDSSTQCCETGCNGCEHDCSSSGFAIVSASTSLTNLANTLSSSDTRQLPVSPYLSDVIPPIS